jgi:phosphoglycolate phosphatase
MEKCAVLFDLDGTLLDTYMDLVNAVNHTLREYGYPERCPEDVRRFLGNGAADLVHRSLPEGVDADLEACFLNDYKAYYNANSQIHTKPYDGVLEVLAVMRSHGIKTAVVSNKPDLTVQGLCKQYFDGLTDFSVGDRPDINRKPAPDPLLFAMKALGCDRAVFVGDSEVDIEAARNATLPCVSVTWGFRDRDVLEESGASIFADTAEELEAEIFKLLDTDKEKN